MLLSVRPLNKPFLIKLGYMVLFFGLMAPLAFGGHFHIRLLHGTEDIRLCLLCMDTHVGNVADSEAQSKVPRVPTTTGDIMKCNDSA